MPVATAEDVAFQLADVTAWLRAWEGSEKEVLPEARTKCLEILNDAWRFLFGGEQIPQRRVKLAPEALAEQVKSMRTLLEKWELFTPKQRNAHLETARDILSSVIAFFSA